MKQKIILILFLMQLTTLSLMAQGDGIIDSVFDTYKTKEGVTLVHLTSDILSEGSRLTLYKSLIIEKLSKKDQKELLTQLLSQKKRWIIKSEIVTDGVVEKATYQLGRGTETSRFLMINTSNKKLTILYLEGGFPPKDLNKELANLKDLFIYVNNKRIELN